LRKIQRRPDFGSGGEVKVSRRTVGAIVVTTNAVIGSNTGLMALYRVATRGLPQYRNRQHRAIRLDQASSTDV
jgi:hypothetical protein